MTQITGQYFNTVGLTGQALKQHREKVNGQTSEVLSIFANTPQVDFSAWEVSHRLGDKYPITSVRRAMNTLFKQDYIVKTGRKIAGPYKESSLTYKLNPNSL